ncbi:RNA polymerase sigma-70 factor [uncultured Bacteroides sp.]|uniref:RNA polymerase sigma-70 factor n=1 Tax=uncultured Bacteroides sp. TaxID=162156 RepID=UPI002AABFBC7|nr:RNA polymerase sigma-70 factor [uncultured Bacteroides sp.]
MENGVNEDHVHIVFDELFRKHYSKLLFYATRFLSTDEAEDIVQETFLELWKRRDSLEMEGQIQAYLYRLVYNKAINVLKHKKIENDYSIEVEEIYKRKIAFYEPDYNDTIKRIENMELRQEIYGMIDQLPDKSKEVFKLSYLHGLKNKEIADVLSISQRTVEAHMYKALKMLRNNLSHLSFLILLNLIY